MGSITCSPCLRAIIKADCRLSGIEKLTSGTVTFRTVSFFTWLRVQGCFRGALLCLLIPVCVYSYAGFYNYIITIR